MAVDVGVKCSPLRDKTYFPDQESRTDAYASPLLAPDLAGPPAVILTAEYDGLRSEGDRNAPRLADADADVVHQVG